MTHVAPEQPDAHPARRIINQHFAVRTYRAAEIAARKPSHEIEHSLRRVNQHQRGKRLSLAVAQPESLHAPAESEVLRTRQAKPVRFEHG